MYCLSLPSRCIPVKAAKQYASYFHTYMYTCYTSLNTIKAVSVNNTFTDNELMIVYDGFSDSAFSL